MTLKPTPTKLPANHRKACSGIAIVEALVSLVIFAVFITGACRMLVAHRRMADMAREHYTAINIAKNRLELARSFKFSQIDRFLEKDTLVDSSGFPDTAGDYRRSTFVTGLQSNLFELAVTVEIRNRKTLDFDAGKEELTTYFTEYLTEDSSVGGGVTPNSTS